VGRCQARKRTAEPAVLFCMLFLPEKGKKVGFLHMQEGLIYCLFPYTNFYDFSMLPAKFPALLAQLLSFFQLPVTVSAQFSYNNLLNNPSKSSLVAMPFANMRPSGFKVISIRFGMFVNLSFKWA
ncbi:hypothetical protein V7150_16920, partial [Neobacillus drentensis]|uniref:hypothetical protein n=1 Tax=Neobacillus drentensis TaxID=220684 RepID=UPI002FFD79D5